MLLFYFPWIVFAGCLEVMHDEARRKPVDAGSCFINRQSLI
jgi:hypothetical protein